MNTEQEKQEIIWWEHRVMGVLAEVTDFDSDTKTVHFTIRCRNFAQESSSMPLREFVSKFEHLEKLRENMCV